MTGALAAALAGMLPAPAALIGALERIVPAAAATTVALAGLPPAGAATAFLLRLAAMACAYLLLLAAVESWFRTGAVAAETTRKAAHLGGALLALPLPWLFDGLAGPLLLGAGFMALLHASRARGWLRSVHGVSRPSHGAVLFPLGLFAGLALALRHADPCIHLVSVLEVGVCDALAAVAGSRPGSTRLGEGSWAKSVEGCAAFFASSLLVTASALWLSGALAPLPALGTGLALAALLTWVEFLGRKGLDNLLLPLAAGTLLPLAVRARPGGWFFLGATALGLAGALLLALAKVRVRHSSVTQPYRRGPRRPEIGAGTCPPPGAARGEALPKSGRGEAFRRANAMRTSQGWTR